MCLGRHPKALRWSRDNQLSVWDALNRISEVEGLTEKGRIGLAKLASQLDGLSKSSPWAVLTIWLFERSDYLQPMLQANTAASQQQLVAIYQLLKVCGEYMALGDASRRRFLARIRRIEALNEDTIYRAVSSEATDMDAVRVMTIHGSKGLEFTAVHLPALATGYMPSGRRAVRIPPPPSLAHLAMEPDDHKIEEECLFFVGLSRARDYLLLSRAERYTSRNCGESRFLAAVADRDSTEAISRVRKVLLRGDPFETTAAPRGVPGERTGPVYAMSRALSVRSHRGVAWRRW